MHDPTKIDYSKLLGFDMVADDVSDGVDFQKASIGTRLGAKVGKMTKPTTLMEPIDPSSEATAAAGPMMVGLSGRTITS